MSELTEYTERKEFWRCPECGDEKPCATFDKPQNPRWCFGEDGSHKAVPTPMSLVERERVFPSIAAWRLLENFETSDWGLLDQAVEHYAANRRRLCRKHHGSERVLADVFARFDAMRRAFRDIRRESPRDTAEGGRVAQEWPS